MAPVQHSQSIFIARIPHTFTKSDVISLVTDDGFHVRVVYFLGSRRFKKVNCRVAAVMLDSEEERNRAVEEMHGKQVNGYVLYVGQLYPSFRCYVPEEVNTAVKITNLSDMTTEADLAQMFAELSLSSCTITDDTALVDFRDPSDAQNAVNQFNNTEIDGRIVSVQACSSREQITNYQPFQRSYQRRQKRTWKHAEALQGIRPHMFRAFFECPLRNYLNPLRRIAEDNGTQYIIEAQLKHEIEKVAGTDPKIMTFIPTFEKYKRIFHTLLYIEEVRMMLDIRQYDLTWQTVSRDKKPSGMLYKVRVPKLAEKRPSVLRGDHVHLRRSDGQGNLYEGYVHFVNLEDILVSFHRKFDANFLYNVQFSFTRTPLRQQHQALDNLNQNVWQRLNLGCQPMFQLYPPSTIRLRGRVPLNAGQIRAVNFGLTQTEQPLIIHGPPGTGKTATVVELILQLHYTQVGKILVCAPSNNAADVLAHQLSHCLSPREMLRLNALQRNPKTLEPSTLLDYSLRTDKGDFALPERHILEAYRVIVCTCVTAGYIRSLGVQPGHFSNIIVDEAGEALETEILIPFQLAGVTSGLVLAGDHLQLGPIVRSTTALTWRMDRSLMERMIEGGRNLRLEKLTQSYRAHPMLLKLYSELFYNNELVACADPNTVNSLLQWPHLPNKTIPMMFAHVEGKEDREPDSPSWFNQQEIGMVEKFVKLLSSWVSAEDIGIIAPYRKQCDKLKECFRRKYEADYRDMKIGTVENFQGMERKVIIISLVRSKEEHLQDDSKFKLGFCANPKRLNVAISRAQALLIVIGNGKLFGKHDAYWRFLLEYCKMYKLFYGPAPTWEQQGQYNVQNNNDNNDDNNPNVDQAWREDY